MPRDPARSRPFLIALVTAAVIGQEPGPPRQPAAHPDRGLPRPDAVWLPYAADLELAPNRVFRSLFLCRCVPAEVGAALPREHGEAAAFFVAGWYFGKRPGLAADARLFGGDGRQLPREGFDEADSRALVVDLAAIDGEVAAALRAEPALAIWLQNDLLRLGRRLLDTGRNPELLAPLLACAGRLALPAAAIAAVPPTFALPELGAAWPGFEPARAVELQRRSTRLFDAGHSLAWARVFVAFPADAEPDLAAWLAAAAAAPKTPPSLPLGTRAVLVQGLVAVDDGGTPRATALAVDVRGKLLVNRSPLAADNATTTRDGVDLRMWSLARQTLRERGGAAGFADFRALAMDDQELFRDYGSLKHTTFAAQCALCHRRSNAPDEPLAGFSSLRPGNNPRPVIEPGERLRQAEAEVARFLATLRAAAK